MLLSKEETSVISLLLFAFYRFLTKTWHWIIYGWFHSIISQAAVIWFYGIIMCSYYCCFCCLNWSSKNVLVVERHLLVVVISFMFRRCHNKLRKNLLLVNALKHNTIVPTITLEVFDKSLNFVIRKLYEHLTGICNIARFPDLILLLCGRYIQWQKILLF